MNILISNDDGINAKGIHVLADCLAQLDDVNIYVCAPDRQRSCCGHALTMYDRLYLTGHDTAEFNSRTVWAAECTGVPADCIRLGLYALKKKNIRIDLVCSGINMGSNYGTDTYYSGTLAAAREAAICFTQAIAFSLSSHEAAHFDVFKKLVPEVVTKAFGKLPHYTILNVNVPDIPPQDIKGLKITRIGPMDYGMDYDEYEDGGYSLPYGQLIPRKLDFDYDLVLGKQGYITMTPCDVLSYNSESEDRLQSLGISL